MTVAKKSVPAVRVDADGTKEVEETVICERDIVVRLCGVQIARLRCLPERLEDLAVGFLFSEGILDDVRTLKGVSLTGEGSVVSVDASIDAASLEGIHKNMLLASGCGKGASLDNLEELMDCKRRFDLSASARGDHVLEVMADFQKRSELFKATGGVHAAAIADETGILNFAEDIGRHNAVDKVIGWAVRKGESLHKKILLTTGRMALDIVAKAVRVGMPILVSRSAPTDRAVELARSFHVALLGFVRGKRMNIYSAATRIKF